MLAQNFKMPTELGITDVEFDALYKVLGMLERGELKHMPATMEDSAFELINGPGFIPQFFNMVLGRSKNSCGSACCIMGWARHVARDKQLFVERTVAICDLFRMSHGTTTFPYPGKYSNEILPDEAAIALRNYLTFGEPRWAEAIAG